MTGFAPTHRWRNVPADALLPPECETRINPRTGRKQARLAPNGGAGTTTSHNGAFAETEAELAEPDGQAKPSGPDLVDSDHENDDFDFAKEYEAAAPDDGAWKAELDLNKDKEPRKNLFNACVALREHPALGGKLAYDEFSGCTVAREPLPWDDRSPRPWTEFDDLKATEWLQAPEVGILVGSAITREAVHSVAHERRFHPVLEYLEGLEWDGEERLSNWLTAYLGVPHSPLADAFGRKFLISAVARVYRPGCKVDHALILEGPQGILKSSALRALVGDDWFTDQIADLGTKDSCQDLRGKWLVELSELSAIRQGEVEKVKAFFSRQFDHYRPSYGRRSGDVPRQTVFVGTTNDSEYLSDPTGGRRFWPVTCTKPDPDAIACDRDQLWAEAVAAYHAGEQWWLEDDELREAARQEQELRRVEDPWESIIADWLDKPSARPDETGTRAPLTLVNGEVTMARILDHAIVKPAERQTKSDQMRVGKILTLLGWKKRKSDSRRLWRRKAGPDD
jgi:putative DNA primase/helicase